MIYFARPEVSGYTMGEPQQAGEVDETDVAAIAGEPPVGELRADTLVTNLPSEAAVQF